MADEEPRHIAEENCFLCAEPIRASQPTTIYAGVPAHTQCYWRDIGLPTSKSKDRGVTQFRVDALEEDSDED
jgi:hypothetical protein